jgi:hypothetical protein
VSDLRVVRGDTPTIDFALTDPITEEPTDLSGAIVWFTVRTSYESDVVFQKKTGGSGIVIDVPAASGRGKVNIAAEDTNTLVNRDLIEFVYDLQVKLVGGAVLTPAKGRFFVEGEVTIGEP